MEEINSTVLELLLCWSGAVISELCNRMAVGRGWQNNCVWQTCHGHYLHVLSWSSLNITVFWSFAKGSGRIIFRTKFLSHKDCCLLSSAILLHKLIIDASWFYNLARNWIYSTWNATTKLELTTCSKWKTGEFLKKRPN